MLVGNRLLAGFSAVAQTRQLSHTACSLSFAYFNARNHMTFYSPFSTLPIQKKSKEKNDRPLSLPSFCPQMFYKKFLTWTPSKEFFLGVFELPCCLLRNAQKRHKKSPTKNRKAPT
jgi:hypothetical protein